MNRNRWIILALPALLLVAGCGDEDEGPNRCSGVTCEPPADFCDGEVAVSYTGAGVCDESSGECDFAAVEVRDDCAEDGLVCDNGACVSEACVGVICETPPEPTCDGTQVVSYAETGYCDDATGTCLYDETRDDCADEGQVCVDGACTDDPCDGVVCETPPEPTCDGDTSLTYAETGTCDPQTGECDYGETRTDCAAAGQVCDPESGLCVAPDLCEGVTCETPPAPVCEGTEAVVYDATGTCDPATGECAYGETRTDCATSDQTCFEGQCVDGALCDAVVCDLPPGPTCDGDAVVTYETAGTCNPNTGECAYTVATTTPCEGDATCYEGTCVTDVSAQIAAVRQAAGTGEVDLPIAGAVVTYVTPSDVPERGFFIQGAQEGPAIFVGVLPSFDLGTLSEGDVVNLTAAAVGTMSGLVWITGYRDLAVVGTADVAALVQEVSANADLITGISAYESELISITGEIAEHVRTAGEGFVQSPFVTAGITRHPVGMTFRWKDDVQLAVDLTEGCQVRLVQGPMWRFLTFAQPTAMYAEDVEVISCPAPELSDAFATAADEVVVLFDRQLDPATVEAADFGIAGLTIGDVTVEGSRVVLTTDAQTQGQSYTLTVTGVADFYGTEVGTPASTTFRGFPVPIGPRNGGMESWFEPELPPLFWSADSGVGAVQSTTARTGAFSVQLTRSVASNGDTDFRSDYVPVTAGRTYDVSMWFLDDSVDARGRLAYQWFDVLQKPLGSVVYGGTYTADGPDWQNLTLTTVAAPSGAWWLRVGTRVYTDGAPTGGSYLLDDVTVTPVPPAGP